MAECKKCFSVIELMCGVLGGIIIFSEWGGLVPVMAGLKIIAALAILTGVVILSLSTGQPNVQDMPSDTVEVKGREGSQA